MFVAVSACTDFLVLRGFEKDIITAVIILSRTPGALAHWRESLGELPKPFSALTFSLTGHSATREAVAAPADIQTSPTKLGWRENEQPASSVFDDAFAHTPRWKQLVFASITFSKNIPRSRAAVLPSFSTCFKSSNPRKITRGVRDRDIDLTFHTEMCCLTNR